MNVKFSDEAIESYRKLDKAVRKAIGKVIEEKLKKRPKLFGKHLRWALLCLYSLRVGKYRIIYHITKENIFVVKIGHRKRIYKR